MFYEVVRGELKVIFEQENTTMKAIFSLILTAIVSVAFAQQTPAEPQKGAILILNATAHLGNGKVIENSAIGFQDGKLTLVGDARTIRIDKSAYERTIVAEGKHVYPGLIAPNTQIGLKEIDAVRSTRDNYEVGEFNPNIRSLIAYNTDSKVTPTIRSNGVMLAQIVPEGGRVTGTSSIVSLDAWNWEDAAYRADDGVHLNWPRPYKFSGFWSAKPGISKNEKYAEQVAKTRAFFEEAKAYQVGNHQEKNLKFEALKGIFDKSQTVFIHAGLSKALMDAVDFAKALDLKIVIVGGGESYMVANLLKENNIPVILAKTQRLPEHQDLDVDMPYKTPALLQKAGVLFCFSENGAWEQRTLPFQAGQAVSYGLDYEAGIQALTLNTAKILGIDKTTGSLETGKDATLILVAGDVLDMRTCKVESAFIQGKEIDLDNKQKALYRKFQAKYNE